MEQNADVRNTMTHFLKSHDSYFIDSPPSALTKSRRPRRTSEQSILESNALRSFRLEVLCYKHTYNS